MKRSNSDRMRSLGRAISFLAAVSFLFCFCDPSFRLAAAAQSADLSRDTLATPSRFEKLLSKRGQNKKLAQTLAMALGRLRAQWDATPDAKKTNEDNASLMDMAEKFNKEFEKLSRRARGVPNHLHLFPQVRPLYYKGKVTWYFPMSYGTGRENPVEHILMLLGPEAFNNDQAQYEEYLRWAGIRTAEDRDALKLAKVWLVSDLPEEMEVSSKKAPALLAKGVSPTGGAYMGTSDLPEEAKRSWLADVLRKGALFIRLRPGLEPVAQMGRLEPLGDSEEMVRRDLTDEESIRFASAIEKIKEASTYLATTKVPNLPIGGTINADDVRGVTFNAEWVVLPERLLIAGAHSEHAATSFGDRYYVGELLLNEMEAPQVAQHSLEAGMHLALKAKTGNGDPDHQYFRHDDGMEQLIEVLIAKHPAQADEERREINAWSARLVVEALRAAGVEKTPLHLEGIGLPYGQAFLKDGEANKTGQRSLFTTTRVEIAAARDLVGVNESPGPVKRRPLFEREPIWDKNAPEPTEEKPKVSVRTEETGMLTYGPQDAVVFVKGDRYVSVSGKEFDKGIPMAVKRAYQSGIDGKPIDVFVVPREKLEADPKFKALLVGGERGMYMSVEAPSLEERAVALDSVIETSFAALPEQQRAGELIAGINSAVPSRAVSVILVNIDDPNHHVNLRSTLRRTAGDANVRVVLMAQRERRNERGVYSAREALEVFVRTLDLRQGRDFHGMLTYDELLALRQGNESLGKTLLDYAATQFAAVGRPITAANIGYINSAAEGIDLDVRSEGILEVIPARPSTGQAINMDKVFGFTELLLRLRQSGHEDISFNEVMDMLNPAERVGFAQTIQALGVTDMAGVGGVKDFLSKPMPAAVSSDMEGNISAFKGVMAQA